MTSYVPGQGFTQGAWQAAEGAARGLVSEVETAGRLPSGSDAGALAQAVVGERLTAGPITHLIEDADIERVVVHGPSRILFSRNGQTEEASARFSTNAQVMQVAERLLAGAGVTIQPGDVAAEGYFPDGARVHVVLPAGGGPVITFERDPGAGPALSDLVSQDTLSQSMASFLQLAVEYGQSVLISSGDREGAHTLISAIVKASSGLRSVVVGPRPVSGDPETSVIHLSPAAGNTGAALMEAMKMAPDCIALTDVGTAGASALSAAAGGGLIGLCAGDAESALLRLAAATALETGGGIEGAHIAARAGVQIVAQIVRRGDGSLRVTHIYEVESEQLSEIYNGESSHQATGHTPAFISAAQQNGHAVDANLFR